MPKAHIIGLGRSGVAAARLLKQQGWTVELSDRNTSTSLQTCQENLQQEQISVQLDHTLSLEQTSPDLIVVSPGVPWDIPILKEARAKSIDTIGEMELAWRSLNTAPWVGITGTNGKTTTTALTAAIFKTAGLHAPACGNIGYAACELAIGEPATRHPYDWIIAEISSYQIESSQDLSPQIGIWTTFTPDHLKRHYTLENYYNIKANLLRRSQQQIFNGDDPYLRNIGRDQWRDAYWTSVLGKDRLLCPPEKGIYIENNQVIALGDPITSVASLKMLGDHNRQNLLLAVAAAKLAGIDNEAIAEAIATFPGVPHRLEYICTHAGVQFINDSKATNYDAAEVGLAAVPQETILIAGGESKEGDDTAWVKMIQAKAKQVFLIGEAAELFAQRLHDTGYKHYEIVGTMERAVVQSFQFAKQNNIPTVLLSPACASFDQYQSFEHRGEHFRELCLRLS
ncbi:UDP-N-acetylmuramoyl-L-alanine--D-glutamate ligase [Spirulina sp. CS-785/01]|uniref:UDP-N-acetylmuramoyl-L-alanine--D-glutamate ligase n=1 Tax=Spirulina sp. CS-785/01 TaxID=3021716 RepID=UPI00232AED97|nr:UDP-N-acetylmuramoyl-L-alanine--D-glutamate ligase [Spirulina sp. CS-785/01]MDB9315480.1 UDP-N-acetylmuramoyl-L-alanine--D-glutamate ligase [Spirulina sp. CS-785/01]